MNLCKNLGKYTDMRWYSGYLDKAYPFNCSYPGPKSDVIPTLGELQQIAYWLSCEIHGLANTEERLSAADVDVETFSIELSGFLKELNCPFESLVAGGGTIHSRLQDNANKTLLLEFLISELMSLRMAYCREPQNNGKVVITLVRIYVMRHTYL